MLAHGVQDQEGEVLQGRFNRARNVMDMYEYQGTKAAELAGEDYAAQNRVWSLCTHTCLHCQQSAAVAVSISLCQISVDSLMMA